MRVWKKREAARYQLAQYEEHVEAFQSRAEELLTKIDSRLERLCERLEKVEEKCCQLVGINPQQRAGEK
jgi:tRNA(Phe) wybutosine-synthesizing methylase Tyw3